MTKGGGLPSPNIFTKASIGRKGLPEPTRPTIRAAEYLTELPSREPLAEKLHASIRRARAQLERRGDGEAIGKKKEELGYGE